MSVQDSMNRRDDRVESTATLPLEAFGSAFGEARRQFLALWLAQTRATTELLGDVIASSVRTAGALWAPVSEAVSSSWTAGTGHRTTHEPSRRVAQGPLGEQPTNETGTGDEPEIDEGRIVTEDAVAAGILPEAQPAPPAADAAAPGLAVTFRLPAAVRAHTAHVCGEFNGWSTSADPMDRLDDGSFELTRVLPVGQRWHYRYLLDGSRWENDWGADHYAPNAFGDHDSVVDLQTPSASRLVRQDRQAVEHAST